MKSEEFVQIARVDLYHSEASGLRMEKIHDALNHLELCLNLCNTWSSHAVANVVIRAGGTWVTVKEGDPVFCKSNGITVLSMNAGIVRALVDNEWTDIRPSDTPFGKPAMSWLRLGILR